MAIGPKANLELSFPGDAPTPMRVAPEEQKTYHTLKIIARTISKVGYNLPSGAESAAEIEAYVGAYLSQGYALAHVFVTTAAGVGDEGPTIWFVLVK